MAIDQHSGEQYGRQAEKYDIAQACRGIYHAKPYGQGQASQ
jgi:hypothetical protein